MARTKEAQALWRERLRIGASVANQLQERMSTAEVAKKLGITPQMVKVIECEALYKLQFRMKELLNERRRQAGLID